MDLRTPLGKVKGLGSAKSGTHHWWMQRVTALALIPLVIWFVLLVIKSATCEGTIVDKLSNPFNAAAMILFIGTSLYHGSLGFRVIVEDYVHQKKEKNLLIIFTNFFTVATAVTAVLAVVYFHMSGAAKASSINSSDKSYSLSEDGKKYKNCNKDKK